MNDHVLVIVHDNSRVAALIAIQQPQLFIRVIFSAPAILPAVGFILVCTSAFTSYVTIYCNGVYICML